MEYDDLLHKHVGAFGRYQREKLAVLSVMFMFHSLYTLNTVFISSTPNHWCRTPATEFTSCSQQEVLDFAIPKVVRHDKDTYSRCEKFVRNYSVVKAEDICGIDKDRHILPTETERCTQWQFDIHDTSESVVAEWSLVCDKAYMAGQAGSMFMIGKIVANSISGPIADRFGRKVMMLVCGVFANIACVSCSFAPTSTVFFVLRFFMGVFITARGFTAFAYGMEFCGIAKRETAGVFLNGTWTVGYMILPLIAYLIRPWRMLQLSLSIPDIAMTFIYFFFIPESPRWLLANGRQQEAYAIIHDMARVNKAILPEKLNIRVNKPKHKVTDTTYIQLIRTPGIRWLTVICMYNWFVSGIVYFGLSFNTSSLLTGDPYVNCFISAAVETVAWPYIIYAFPRFGRCRSYFVAMIASGAFLLLSAAIPQDMSLLFITISMMGKATSSVAGLCSWLYVYEAYPTTLKVTALNINGMSNKVGGALGAYTNILSDINRALPMVIFGALSLIASFLVLALPETKGASVKQTTEDGEKFIRENSCLWWRKQTKQKKYLQSYDAELEEQLIKAARDADSDLSL